MLSKPFAENLWRQDTFIFLAQNKDVLRLRISDEASLRAQHVHVCVERTDGIDHNLNDKWACYLYQEPDNEQVNPLLF